MAKQKSAKPLIDMSGLERFQLDQAEEQTQAEPVSVSDGRPLEILLDNILEDPTQPRTVFDEDSLQELAASIALFGVLMPISIRPNLTDSGYIINSGARRYRASKIAGQKTIPAFIQTEYDKYGQMAENIHRDNLKPLEIASFISEEVKNGKKKGDIAKALGKSGAFISQYLKLATAPDWIKDLSARGVCADVTTLTELVKVAESGKVENLEETVAEMKTISRSDVQSFTRPAPEPTPTLQEFYNEESSNPYEEQLVESKPINNSQGAEPSTSSDDSSSIENKASKPKKDKEPDLEKAVYIGGRKGFLQTKQVEVWWDDTGEFEKIPLKDLPSEVLEH